MKQHAYGLGLVLSPLALACLALGCSGVDAAGGFDDGELGSIEQAVIGNPACGDGYLDVGEQCDDGNLAFGDGCGVSCTLEREMSIAPGSHKLKNLLNGCMDVSGVSSADGASVINWQCHGKDNQLWRFQPWGGGYSALIVKHSGKCAEVSGASLLTGAKTVQATCGELPAHRVFRPSPTNGPYFSLVALHSDRCLRVENGSIVQGSCDGSAGATWIQELVGLDVAAGFGTLRNRQDARCADISGNSSSDNASLIVWPCHGGANQDFDFRPASGEFYSLVLRHSSKCVDVVPDSVLGGVDGQAARQLSCRSGAQNQQFIPVATDGGYFELRAKHSDMCLDALPGSINVVQKRCNGSASQQWRR